jgi:nucleotide-binding universal stress UspA family protein
MPSDPADGVLRIAEEVGATMICAGTTGKSGIERLLIGSVARRLLHDSKTPLLLTHDG